METPYHTLAEASKQLGLKVTTARNKIANGTFPVPTYKLGKPHVVDKAVLAAYFENKRRECLAALNTTAS